MAVRDELKVNHAEIMVKRHYPEREATLRANAEMQKADAVKPTNGLRAFANFPPHELERLAEKGRTDKNTPSWYADLTSRDPEISSRAKKRLVNSADGKQYRVGAPSRKVFFIKNNPLAK